jgi:hypothetical protein
MMLNELNLTLPHTWTCFCLGPPDMTFECLGDSIPCSGHQDTCLFRERAASARKSFLQFIYWRFKTRVQIALNLPFMWWSRCFEIIFSHLTKFPDPFNDDVASEHSPSWSQMVAYPNRSWIYYNIITNWLHGAESSWGLRHEMYSCWATFPSVPDQSSPYHPTL